MEEYILYFHICCQSTDQLFSSSVRKASLKHVHEEFPAVGNAMSVLRQSEQEPLVIVCAPTTEPAESKDDVKDSVRTFISNCLLDVGKAYHANITLLPSVFHFIHIQTKKTTTIKCTLLTGLHIDCINQPHSELDMS